MMNESSPRPAFADEVLTANAEPLHAADHEVLVDVSVGVADGNAGDRYRHAEIALREAGGHRRSGGPLRLLSSAG